MYALHLVHIMFKHLIHMCNILNVVYKVYIIQRMCIKIDVNIIVFVVITHCILQNEM